VRKKVLNRSQFNAIRGKINPFPPRYARSETFVSFLTPGQIEGSLFFTLLRDVQYGKSKRYDFLKAGSLWKEPQYFMMGLLEKERELASVWPAENDTKMRDDLREILMKATPLSQGIGSILVTYDFQNLDQCKKEVEATEDDAL
jgi:hypothetical protein